MSKSKTQPDPMLYELESIKKLLAFLLVRDGAKRNDIARVLGRDPAIISRMLPKEIKRREDAGNRSKTTAT